MHHEIHKINQTTRQIIDYLEEFSRVSCQAEVCGVTAALRELGLLLQQRMLQASGFEPYQRTIIEGRNLAN